MLDQNKIYHFLKNSNYNTPDRGVKGEQILKRIIDMGEGQMDMVHGQPTQGPHMRMEKSTKREVGGNNLRKTNG